jgi:hypothetical protein
MPKKAPKTAMNTNERHDAMMPKRNRLHNADGTFELDDLYETMNLILNERSNSALLGGGAPG